MIFKIGDTVEWCGARGVVESISATLPGYLRVNFGHGGLIEFTIDGRFHYWHTKPSLTLIERPKKKVKKQIEAWAVVCPDGTAFTFPTHHIASAYMKEISKVNKDMTFSIVKLTGEISKPPMGI